MISLRKKKSNEFDVITLGTEIEEHTETLAKSQELEISLKTKLIDIKNEIITLTNEKEAFLNSKERVDVEITALNPSSLEKDIEEMKTNGIGLKEEVVVLRGNLEKIGVLEFDEDLHFSLTKTLNQETTNIAVKESEITRLKKVITDLINGGICQSCNRKLDDVDNTEHIAKHEGEIERLEKENGIITKVLERVKSQIESLNTTKKLVDTKNRIELDISRKEVEMGLLRNKITSKKNDLDKYKMNLDAIEFNKNVDIQVANVKTKISVAEYTKDQTVFNINRLENDIKMLIGNIDTKKKLIETIKKEEEVEKIFKIYIELVGKKGISKLVLRSVLPIINSELQRLLDDVVDFEIEIFMDDKNDVQFLLVKDGISKLLKSGSGLEKTAASLALRCVLGRVSTLPMPNFITFDEILGKIAPENLEKLKMLFDKIKDMYDIVFFITHNDLVKDWNDGLITIIKENNVSKVSIK